MPPTRRFFFFGNAAAMSGRIYRPRPFDLNVACASSLTPAGGLSSARIRGTKYTKRHDGLVEFKRASTYAEGRFTDQAAATEMTWHRVTEDALRTSTVVRSEVTGLQLKLKRRFHSMGVCAELTSGSPEGAGEAPIEIGSATGFGGLALDNCPFEVEVDRDLFNKHQTRATLLAACQDGGFLREHATSLLAADRLDAASTGRQEGRPSESRYRADVPQLYVSLVKEIRWVGEKPAWATIVGHTMRVEDVGTIFFGEILVSHGMRRLTMLRFELGSPVGGRLAFAAVEKNGSWVP